MNMHSRLNCSSSLIRWIGESMNGLEWSSDTRSVIAGGCLDVALEHHEAIILLVKNKHIGSAFALVRCVFEAYIRAVWLHRCASDFELESFQNEKLYKKFDDILSEIKTIEGFDAGILSEVKKHWWSPMNSFTHCGYAQVARRYNGMAIGPDYDEEDVCKALRFVDGVALLVVGYAAGQVGDMTLQQSVLKKIDEFSKEIASG